MMRWLLGPLAMFLPLLVLGGQMEAQERERDRGGERQRPRGMRMAEPNALKVAEQAPRFVLKSLDGESETDLDALFGDKPIVLLFGSYT